MSTSASSGEFDLGMLIKSMEPVLCPETYVFVTVENSFNADALSPLMTFQEREGATLIVTQQQAEAAGIEHEFPCRKITLNVHSSLGAVGFLARITQRLAKLQLGVNPVSGFYHDHLFVPMDRAEDAMAELRLMSDELCRQ